MNRELILALVGLLFYFAWALTVLVSFGRWAQGPHHELLFGTNNKRWCWLAGFTLVFLVLCFQMGWGQPMIRSLEEEIASSPRYPQAEYAAKATGKAFWNLLELDKYQKALKLDSAPPPNPKTEPERKFYGLRSWSHWFVFWLFYFPTFFIYGAFAIREEVLEGMVSAIKRFREGRQPRLYQAQAGGQPAAATSGPSLAQSVVLFGFLDLLIESLEWILRKKKGG